MGRPSMLKTENLCTLCGEPMPAGEEMFKFHGYSGLCPKPPLPKEKPTEFAWVIEGGDTSRPHYWDGRALDSFTHDHLEAVRFARREDADRIKFVLLNNEHLRVCEHGWS